MRSISSNYDSDLLAIKNLPPYVFSIVGALADRARDAGKKVIDLGMGNPDLPPPKKVVDTLIEQAQRTDTHGYSKSGGIKSLRTAFRNWYGRTYDVDLDQDREIIVVMGSKEGLAHVALSLLQPGDSVVVPDPAYPVHPYGILIAGGKLLHIPITDNLNEFCSNLDTTIRQTWPRPKLLILNFPHNPTTTCVDIDFFERIVEIASEYQMWVVHDIAYVNLVYDGYRAPSFLQAKGARNIGIETVSLSKSYNMAGWRVGACCGNYRIVGALGRLKSYLDYGQFYPIQKAAETALNDCDDEISQTVNIYKKRRDILVAGLAKANWEITPCKASMFLWAKIPHEFREVVDSITFSKKLMQEANVVVAPGYGFGNGGEGHVRISLLGSDDDLHLACKRIEFVLNSWRKDGVDNPVEDRPDFLDR